MPEERRNIKIRVLPINGDGGIVFDADNNAFIICEPVPERRDAAILKAIPIIKLWLATTKIKKTASETILTVKNKNTLTTLYYIRRKM